MDIKYNHDKKFLTYWNLKANEIITKTNDLIKKSTYRNDELAKINLNSNKNIKDFLNKLSDEITEFEIFHSICGFLHYVSPDEKKRKASFMADLLLSKHGNELNLRKDIYNKL